MNTPLSPSEQGFLLEEIIHDAISKIPGIDKNFRENDIKNHFNDLSLNGVDHWINVGNNHVLIQDKWKDNTGQQEVSQYLQCAERINRRIPRDDNIYLLWVSKISPTSNSVKSLIERGVEILTCSVSVEALAKIAIMRIANCLNIDSVPALLSIPKTSLPVPIERAATIIDEEALEILKIRRELNERKRLEEKNHLEEIKKEKEMEEYFKELLKTDRALIHKMGLRNAYGDECPWVWNTELANHPTVKEMIKANQEIQDFRVECIPKIKTAIQNAMKDLWDDSTNDRIYQRQEIQNSGGSGWSQPDIRHYLGTFYKTFRDEDYWKSIILEEIGKPLFHEEYQKWYSYCQIFLERNKEKINTQELLDKIADQEKLIATLKKKIEKTEETFKLLYNKVINE